MSRKFLLALLALLLSLAVPSSRERLWAQDLDDVDMFGDSSQEDQSPQPPDDQLDLGQFRRPGCPDCPDD